MKLKFSVDGRTQPDPFIFQDGEKFYLYVTALDGVEAYSTDDVFGTWQFEGIVTAFQNAREFWAPSVIKIGEEFYLYVSCATSAGYQFMHVAKANSPLGPFKDEKLLYDRFSIDSHVVQTSAGLFLWFAQDSYIGERIGTRVFVDRLLDPYTPEGNPIEKIVPTFDEEIYTPSYRPDNKWHTIEGPFWFQDGDWQYLMYSGGCYQDDTYHVGYAVAKTDEPDLRKVEFVKHTTIDGRFDPVIIKNDFEEGTGHHSVIQLHGTFYAIYHGRNYEVSDVEERRTARICKMTVQDGKITAEQFENHI